MKTTMLKAFLLMLAISAAFILLTSMKETTPSPNTTNGDIKLTDLTFSRKAVQLTGWKKEEFPLTEQGFLWDKGDSKTYKFRTQGITTVKESNGREFVIVSWYGRQPRAKKDITGAFGEKEGKENYRNRGARISVVDVSLLKSNPSVNNYKHILLVDDKKQPFYQTGLKEEKGTMHAGGIAYIDGMLHVADSRAGYKVIRVFDMNKIQKIDPKILKYDHILIEAYHYKSPSSPSFLSYDKNRKELLTGSFREKPSDTKPNFLVWFKPPMNAADAKNFDETEFNIYRLPNKYRKIQGIGCMADPKDASKQILWISTSYAAGNRSNLYKLQIDGKSSLPSTSASPSTATNPTMIIPISSAKKLYPPGLEDVNISDNQQTWLLTEFYYSEGSYYPLDVPPYGKSDGFNPDGTPKTYSKSKDTRRGVFAINYDSEL